MDAADLSWNWSRQINITGEELNMICFWAKQDLAAFRVNLGTRLMTGLQMNSLSRMSPIFETLFNIRCMYLKSRIKSALTRTLNVGSVPSCSPTSPCLRLPTFLQALIEVVRCRLTLLDHRIRRAAHGGYDLSPTALCSTKGACALGTSTLQGGEGVPQ